MIYKLQRLFADNNNQQSSKKNGKGGGKPNNPPEQPQKKEYVAPKTTIKQKKYKTPDEAIKGIEKEYRDKLPMFDGEASMHNIETGKRETLESLQKERDAKLEIAREWEKQEKARKREERADKIEQKIEKATKKTKDWAKKNKKGLIIGGSVLAAGTGATIIGSKIYKKNKQNKIKEDVRGYSDVED